MTMLEFTRRGETPPYDFNVIIDGELRARFCKSAGRAYWLYTLDNQMVRDNYAPKQAETKADLEAVTLHALECGKIPTLEGYAQRKADCRAMLAAKIAEWKERERWSRATMPEVFEALKHAVRIAGEAQKEWDAAPDGMKAGKLLIALAGGIPGYKYHTDLIHELIKRLEAPSPEPDDTQRDGFIYEIKRATDIWSDWDKV